jgi:hypothetical protein
MQCCSETVDTSSLHGYLICSPPLFLGVEGRPPSTPELVDTKLLAVPTAQILQPTFVESGKCLLHLLTSNELQMLLTLV